MLTKNGNSCNIGSKGENEMTFLLIGLSGFALGLVVYSVIDIRLSQKDDDEHIKFLQGIIDERDESINAKNELIERQQKIIALQKIAIDTYKDVLKAKEIM